jgi:hypothetical protein
LVMLTTGQFWNFSFKKVSIYRIWGREIKEISTKNRR